MAAVKYREVTSVEIREAFRQQLSITEIQAALADAAGVGLNTFFCAPCCLCGASPTVLFGLIAKDRITLMTFVVCNACITKHGLLPSDPGSEY
jgi:hypothetical protein